MLLYKRTLAFPAASFATNVQGRQHTTVIVSKDKITANNRWLDELLDDTWVGEQTSLDHSKTTQQEERTLALSVARHSHKRISSS